MPRNRTTAITLTAALLGLAAPALPGSQLPADLQAFLFALCGLGGTGGAMTYAIVRWILKEARIRGYKLKPNKTRDIVYLLCFALGIAGLAAAHAIGYVDATPDHYYAAAATAFLVSQKLHADLELVGDTAAHEQGAPRAATTQCSERRSQGARRRRHRS